MELEFEELFDELLELLFDERRVGWSGAMPTARAARFMPFSQPLKKLCTAVSPRGLLRLLLLDELLLLLLEELELLLLDEFELEFEEELDDEFELELEEEFEEELDDELEPRPKLPPPPDPPPDDAPLPPRDPPLELLFELLLPALIFKGSRLASTPLAAWVSSFTSGRPWAWAPWLPTTLATAVTMAPMLFFMTVLYESG